MNQPSFEPRSHAFSDISGEALEPSQNRQISAEYFLKLGNRHYNAYLSRAIRRDLDAAVQHYQQAFEMNPALPEVHLKLAAAQWDKGGFDLSQAIQACETALHLSPDYAEAHLFLGYFLKRDGRLQEAAEQFRQAIRKTGKRSPAKAKMALGRALIEQASQAPDTSAGERIRTVAAGLGEFGAGCLLLPTDGQSFTVIQHAFVTDTQIFSITGLGRLLKSTGLRGQAAKLYEWATTRLPQEPIFFHLLGDLHAERKNMDGALYFYNRAQELDPDSALLHKKLGRAYRQCNDSANAARSLEKVVAAEAQDFDTLYMLAQIYSDRCEYMRSLYYFKEIIREAPDNPYVRSNMAYVLFKLEDYDGAILEYQSAVNFGEDPVWTATVAQTLGTIQYQIKNDLEAAVGMFQLAYQLDPGNLECLSMLGDIYTEQGDFEAAIQAYRYILSVEPDNADCYNYLGYLLWQLDKNDEAITAYRKGIALKSDNHIAYNNLGVIFLDEKCQPQSALELFEQAVLLKPDYTLACFNVGRTREALGQTAEAARAYTDAIALNTQNPELTEEEIHERLDQLFKA